MPRSPAALPHVRSLPRLYQNSVEHDQTWEDVLSRARLRDFVLVWPIKAGFPGKPFSVDCEDWRFDTASARHGAMTTVFAGRRTDVRFLGFAAGAVPRCYRKTFSPLP